MLDGDSYHITVVPDDPDATVTMFDNGVNVTSSLEFEEGVDKNNNRIVNYVYRLTNIHATHTLTASCVSAGQQSLGLYLKISGT